MKPNSGQLREPHQDPSESNCQKSQTKREPGKQQERSASGRGGPQCSFLTSSLGGRRAAGRGGRRAEGMKLSTEHSTSGRPCTEEGEIKVFQDLQKHKTKKRLYRTVFLSEILKAALCTTFFSCQI